MRPVQWDYPDQRDLLVMQVKLEKLEAPDLQVKGE